MVCLCVITSFISFYYTARGHWWTFVFAIISYGIYVPFCIIYKYYGELAISFICIAVYFVTLFKWKRNTAQEVVKIKKLGMREILICYAVLCVAIFGVWWVLWALGSAEPLLNAVGTCALLLSFYFDYRISRQAYVALFLNYVMYFVLWILAGVNGDEAGVMLLSIGAVIEMGYVVFSFIKWGQLYKKQATIDNAGGL